MDKKGVGGGAWALGYEHDGEKEEEGTRRSIPPSFYITLDPIFAWTNPTYLPRPRPRERVEDVGMDGLRRLANRSTSVPPSMGMNMEMRGEETWRAAAVEQGREVGGSLPKSGHANRAPGAGLGSPVAFPARTHKSRCLSSILTVTFVHLRSFSRAHL
ncbi:uncharacterized protein CLUP02_16330 [Colletotrichum lupini]|uniref:Uncharacterized protein n=1 Tax=Colletotrichum lupini TaxID=145971 RepID=A0A9Q8WQ21_9PEZI|nr:uncharacterized protein CLUP02_16330 [Colletotrichum lupini]UQC90800.1 hypothetical protein CLUP02_16330 [Colletotrichum lupini]